MNTSQSNISSRAYKHLLPGDPFPKLHLKTCDGTQTILGQPEKENAWQLIAVYRGAHCSICQMFLGQLEEHRNDWEELGVEVITASADPADVTKNFLARAEYHGQGACGLDVDQMKALGLWITGTDQSDLDYEHPEPGLFLVDPEGRVAAAEVSSLPFLRPDLSLLSRGIAFMIERDIRPSFGCYEVMS